MLKERCKELLRSVANGFESISNTAGVDTRAATKASAEAMLKLAQSPSFGHRLGLFVRASYLTSLGAHVVNGATNGLQIALQPVLTALSGRPREAAAMLNLRALGEGFSLAGSRFMSTFKNEAMDPSRIDFTGRITDDETLNRVLTSPLTLTRAIDNASKAILETMSHQALYHRIKSQIPESYLKKRDITPDQLRKGINDYLLGNETKDSKVIEFLEKSVPNVGRYRSYVTNVSDYATFNRQLGDSILDQGAKALEGWREKHPLLTFVFPFIKTPVNVAKEGSGYIPGLGYVRERQAKADIAKIKNEIEGIKEGFKKADERQMKINEAGGDPLQQSSLNAYRKRLQDAKATKEGELMMLQELPARYRAQQLIGAGLMTYAYSLYDGDQITGHFVDPTVRATREAQGIPPMSIKIGDRWVSYDKVEPLSTVLGVVADGFESWNKFKREGKEVELKDMANTVFQTVGQNIFNKTFTEQLGNMMMALQQPERYGNAFTQLLNPLVPAIVAQGAKYRDPMKRDVSGENIVESLTNPLRARIPGMREDLPQVYNALGQPAKAAATDSELAKAADIFAGIKTAPVAQSDQQALLNNPYVSIGKLGKKVQGIELTPKQYSEMTKQAGELVNDIITDLSKDADFRALSRPLQGAAIKKVVNRARTGGRNMYLADMLEDPEVLDKFIEGKLRSKGAQEEEQ
jgi:hypothetical protein